MNLQQRCKKMISELGIRVVTFCQNAGIGHSTYYMWLNNQITISEKLQNRIDSYLKKYGF